MSQRNQAGGTSGYCGRPSFSESQACLLDVQMCSVGSNKSGSSRLPIVRPIVFAFCRSEKRVVPHWVQKPRRTPDSALHHPMEPAIEMLSSGTITREKNGEPIDFLQRDRKR